MVYLRFLMGIGAAFKKIRNTPICQPVRESRSVKVEDASLLVCILSHSRPTLGQHGQILRDVANSVGEEVRVFYHGQTRDIKGTSAASG